MEREDFNRLIVGGLLGKRSGNLRARGRVCHGFGETLKTDSQYYRPDIDGVRGIAVLFVLAYHCYSPLLRGGFVGVDVFFVISGYLISSIIFKDILDNRFSIAKFYERRIKRIFPALITVLASTLALGWFFLLPSEFKNLGKHIVGGATFTSNIILWRETGYFETAAELKPLLHLWSLGVEEQFYIFFPISMWLIYRMGIATTKFLGIVLVLSLAVSTYGTFTRPTATFYLPVTRLWELLVGCILASIESECMRLPGDKSSVARYFTNHETNLFLRNMVSWLGMAMIVGAAIFLTEARPFPGGWALLPTVGTALVISSGRQPFLNRWILGNKILVGVGLISYPLYLWHWPLLSMARIVDQEKGFAISIWGIVIISGLLAWLTYWCIERPIRFGGVPATRRVRQLCAGMTGLLVVGGLTMVKRMPSRLGMSPVSQQIDTAVSDWNYPFYDNFMLLSDFKKDMDTGRGNGDPATLFVGDSHMQQYWPRIETLLNGHQSGTRPVILITASGTPALPNVNKVKPGYACDKFFEFVMREATKPTVGTVVFGCFWENYFIGSFPGGSRVAAIYRVGDRDKVPLRLDSPAASQVFAEFGQAIARLVSMRKEVVVILSSPSCERWNPMSLAKALRVAFFDNVSVTNEFRVARRDFEAFVQPVKRKIIDVVVANGGKVIDPLDYFERDGFLYGRTDEGAFLYKDSNHMRAGYVKEKATFLDSLIESKGLKP